MIVFAMTLTGCEDVVDVDLGTSEPRLVIDALIRWEKGTPGNEQMIRLSMTAPYFADEVPPVSGASVTVTGPAGVFTFAEEQPGRYVCQDFVPEIGAEYTLQVIHGDDVYSATEKLFPVPAISSVEQSADGGFTGEDIEVKAFFNDDGTTEDQYLFRFKSSHYAIPFYEVIEDRFFQGNQIFALYSDDELEAGDELEISVMGISRRYYNYMNILTGIAGSNGGSPFSTAPATVRGNIVNQTDEDKYTLGFFALGETSSANYIVQ